MSEAIDYSIASLDMDPKISSRPYMRPHWSSQQGLITIGNIDETAIEFVYDIGTEECSVTVYSNECFEGGLEKKIVMRQPEFILLARQLEHLFRFRTHKKPRKRSEKCKPE